MIHVEGLTRRFGPVTAISNLSFHLERGEVVGFLGPNGAGKTTTMRILAGYLPASAGRVEVSGLDVLRQSLAARRCIGYLPEAVPLYPEHRVSEMLVFQARLHGMPRADYRRRIPEVLARVGIADRARSLIGRLSRGQRQRVGLAVALLPAPEVLILDEPTSGLDPLQRIEVRALLRELAAEHTVLLSSHILPEIEAVASRVIMLHEGVIAADGRPEELVRRFGEASHVRVEAFVRDPAEARRLLGAIAGAGEVCDRGRLGIHHQFDVLCESDLREDIGALAASRGWALRELSFRRPTLEELFARIALGERGAVVPPAAAAAPPSPAGPASEHVALELAFPAQALPPQAAPAPAKKPVYNLNPFERGAQRDLGAPLDPSKPPAPPSPPPIDPPPAGRAGEGGA
jgi:ABC-2 type transport system ATP-binding protein